MFVHALVLLAVTAPVESQPREVSVAVYGEDGEPVASLDAESIVVEEDGEKRRVLSVRRDERPADVALILDSSQWMGDDYRDILVPAALEFRAALPVATRLTVWTCGGKIDQVVEFGTEPEAAREALLGRARGGPNFCLEAVSDVSADLAAENGLRRYVVLLSTTSIKGSKNLMDRAYRSIPESVVTPVFVIAGSAGTLSGSRVGGEGRTWDVESVMEDLATGYGGYYEFVLTTQSTSRVLSRVAAAITSEFRVKFESEADALRRPGVEIDQKGVKILRSGYAFRAY